MDEEFQERVRLLFPELAEDIRQQFIRVCSLSDYVHQSTLQHGNIVGDLFSSGDLVRQYESETLILKFKQSLEQPIQIKEFDSRLRRIRRREMVRIIFRDFSRIADLVETTRDLSDLAECSIDTALGYHYQNNCSKLGVPKSQEGDAQKMCVLALGKLGAKELNLSSDIDLIFLYLYAQLDVSKAEPNLCYSGIEFDVCLDPSNNKELKWCIDKDWTYDNNGKGRKIWK